MSSDQVSDMKPPVLADLQAAAMRLAGKAVRTPLLRSPVLDALTGAQVFIKPENLQRQGAFKFRGAYNLIANLPPEARAKGVLAWSSGNHAQGVAMAAQMFGVPAVIVMPQDAPAMKIANTRALGAEIVLYDRYTQSREGIGLQLAQERGLAVAPPFDHPDTIAGQGTIGLEIAEDLKMHAQGLDSALICCSGGGLAAGIGIGLKANFPDCALFGVEPAACDDTARSFAAGERRSNGADARTICDALMTPTPGALTFPINQRNLAGVVTVTDDEVLDALACAFETLKLVVEPGGAVALAALLHGKIASKGRNIAVILSGGNVDPDLFADAIRRDWRKSLPISRN